MTTWTCDACEQPNFRDVPYCKRCGAPRPGRYGQVVKNSFIDEIIYNRKRGDNDKKY